MKVSILLPTLNRLNYLKESLTSAREQTYQNLEILVSDDGSSDGSQVYVQKIATLDPRVRPTNPNPHPGLFQNINHLVQQSTGDAFCLLGDDDRLRPDFVQKLVQPLIENAEVVASFCDFYLIDRNGKMLKEDSEVFSRAYGRESLPEGILVESLIPAMNVTMCMGFSLYRSNVFRRESFDLKCGGAADVDYAIRAAQLGKLYYVKERLGDFRFHEASISRSRASYMIDGLVHVYNKYAFSDARDEQMRKRLLRTSYRVGTLYYCAENRQEWLRSLRGYWRCGGRILDPKILLSFLIAAFPGNSARRLKASYKAIERRFLRT